MTSVTHNIRQGRDRPSLPEAVRKERQEAYRNLVSKLQALGLVKADIATALGITPSYINMMREKQTPPLHILAALRRLLIAEMQEAEARKRAEADRIAVERQALERAA